MKQLTKTRTKRKGLRTLQINKRMTMYSSDNSCDILIILNLNAINVIFCQWWSLSGFVCLIFRKEIIENIHSWNCGIPLQLKSFLYFLSFSTILPVKTNFIKIFTRIFFGWEYAKVQHFCRFPLICWRHIHSLFGSYQTFSGAKHFW